MNRSDAGRFPGERRTTTGRFTGTDGRLVHVAPDGRLGDFGYPLCGLEGIERARFGLEVGGEVVWPDPERSSQRYLGDSTAVETVHGTDHGTLTRLDVATGRAHLTRATIDPTPEVAGEELALSVAATFRPDGRKRRVGQLHLEDWVEIYHADERDYLGARPGFADLEGRTELPPDVRAERVEGDHNEEDKLTGTVVGTVPFEEGTAAVASLLTDGRSPARERIDELLGLGAGGIRRVGREGLPSIDEGSPWTGIVADDLRVLSLLSAGTGLRIAGPDFDRRYLYSGGYGYTWFRDDAEIAGALLAADRRLDLGLDDWHRRSAAQYVALQRADGSWPHRVWPRDGALAPGWANARLEDGDDRDYQADQTASVLAFLAAYRRAGFDADGLDPCLAAGRASLDSTLADDGRPVPCQNAWEDMTGRFTHTAATFLEAYGELAATESDAAEGAAERAATVHDAIDDLWLPDRGCYALREELDGDLDPRYDSATFALPAAHRAFDSVGSIGERRLDRLVSHVEATLEGLTRETGALGGVVRYEGDEWRRNGQDGEKVWTVSTAWAADACAHLAVLLDDRGDSRAPRFARRARELLALIEPEGPLCEPTGYLPEQFFDDGTPDSATPLGWPHAVRTATVALLSDHDLFSLAPAASGD